MTVEPGKSVGVEDIQEETGKQQTTKAKTKVKIKVKVLQREVVKRGKKIQKGRQEASNQAEKVQKGKWPKMEGKKQ